MAAAPEVRGSSGVLWGVARCQSRGHLAVLAVASHSALALTWDALVLVSAR